MEGLVALFLFAVCLLGYLFPAMVGTFRRHPNQNAIFVLNLLLGWTLIGWIASLVWACTATKPTIVYAQQPPASS